MRIDADAWGDWLGHPITEAFLKFCRQKAEEQKGHWHRISWEGGQSDPLTLARLKERAATLEEVSQLTREDIEEGLMNVSQG